jgi:signal transduction histidine kinase
MEQVLSRIIYGALTGTDENMEVWVHAGPSTDKKNEVQISVRARGLDVAEEDMALIFGPSAAVITERPSSGRALGLAVARALVEMHGGRIWVADDDAGEATIAMTVPKHEAKADGPSVIVRSEASGSQGAEVHVEGESDDSGRRPVGTETGARQPEPRG